MAREKQVFPRQGIDLVRRLVAEGERIFTVERARKIAPEVGLTQSYLRQSLHHLANSGWLVRLRQGLYAVSSSVPGVTAVHEYEIAMALVMPAAISHWSALHYHGLSDQTPRKVFVLTTTGAAIPRLRGKRLETVSNGYPAGNALFQFIQVKPERYFGTEQIWIGEARVTITDPERTLLDGLSMPQYCGDFGEVLHAFEVRGGNLDVARILDYAIKLDGATAKRLGWVLERQGIATVDLEPLVRIPIKGYRKLDPTGPRIGPYDSRWMIQVNIPGRVKS